MNKAEIINGLEDLVRSTKYSLVCLQGENPPGWIVGHR